MELQEVIHNQAHKAEKRAVEYGNQLAATEEYTGSRSLVERLKLSTYQIRAIGWQAIDAAASLPELYKQGMESDTKD